MILWIHLLLTVLISVTNFRIPDESSLRKGLFSCVCMLVEATDNLCLSLSSFLLRQYLFLPWEMFGVEQLVQLAYPWVRPTSFPHPALGVQVSRCCLASTFGGGGGSGEPESPPWQWPWPLQFQPRRPLLPTSRPCPPCNWEDGHCQGGDSKLQPLLPPPWGLG